MKEFFLENEKFTEDIGRKLGKRLFPGAIICLNGDLGAGKTTITKSIAKAMGIEDDITSPTFNIVNEYTEGNITLYHFDVYRIACSEEMYDIGFEEYINSDGVCIIEWSNLIEDILPEERLEILLTYQDGGRKIALNPVGSKYEKIVEEVTV